MLISHNVAVYRKRAGMSQEDLAERLHVSRQTISKWETGQSAPDPETVVQLARLFGITTDQLLTEETPAPFPEAPPSPEEAPPVTKVPLLDAHVLGRYIFLAVTFLGGILLFGLWLLAARWEVWFVDWFDILISLLMILMLSVPPLVVTVQYVASKCRAAISRRKSKNESNRHS